jgi:hypothetical protein
MDTRRVRVYAVSEMRIDRRSFLKTGAVAGLAGGPLLAINDAPLDVEVQAVSSSASTVIGDVAYRGGVVRASSLFNHAAVTSQNVTAWLADTGYGEAYAQAAKWVLQQHPELATAQSVIQAFQLQIGRMGVYIDPNAFDIRNLLAPGDAVSLIGTDMAQTVATYVDALYTLGDNLVSIGQANWHPAGKKHLPYLRSVQDDGGGGLDPAAVSAATGGGALLDTAGGALLAASGSEAVTAALASGLINLGIAGATAAGVAATLAVGGAALLAVGVAVGGYMVYQSLSQHAAGKPATHCHPCWQTPQKMPI